MAAEALLARAFLFYTGYYNKTTMGTVTKDEVVADLNDCIANSGHKLMPDFRNLWPYSNGYTKADYAYSKDNDLSWYGETATMRRRYSPSATVRTRIGTEATTQSATMQYVCSSVRARATGR
jgi:hypothetical protein